VYARRQFCGNLEVYRPSEPLWNPRLREAATTLAASGESVVEKVARLEKRVQPENVENRETDPKIEYTIPRQKNGKR